MHFFEVGLNSGLQFASAQGAAGDALSAQALAGEQASANQFQRQQGALGQAANLGGEMFGQDVGIEQTNANILNSFNQRAVQNAQQANQFNAQQRSAAQAANQGLMQDTANRNTAQGNASQYEQRDFTNKMEKDAYQRQMDKINAKQGIASNRINDINANTNQQNQAISGLGSGITNVAGYYQDREDKKAGYKN